MQIETNPSAEVNPCAEDGPRIDHVGKRVRHSGRLGWVRAQRYPGCWLLVAWDDGGWSEHRMSYFGELRPAEVPA